MIYFIVAPNSITIISLFASSVFIIENYTTFGNISDRTIKTMALTRSPKYAENNQPFTVLIEGNIGSGKTTFLNHFNKFDDICLLSEPVERWQDVGGCNLLVSILN